MKKRILSLIIGFGTIGLANAGESIANPKTTATMQATCSIEVIPIGFGVVATPLMSQTSQSEMNVKCSNSTPYTIDLAYGGVYGSGMKNYNLIHRISIPESSGYNLYDIQGSDKLTGYVACAESGKISFGNIELATIYGYNESNKWISDNLQVCNGRNIKSNTITIPFDYDYGVMNGSFKGDKLAYSIAVPGDSTKVWNAGNNSYKISGNGEFQVIPVVAKIVPDKSGSKYPAPDMYLDTITAIISY